MTSGFKPKLPGVNRPGSIRQEPPARTYTAAETVRIVEDMCRHVEQHPYECCYLLGELNTRYGLLIGHRLRAVFEKLVGPELEDDELPLSDYRKQQASGYLVALIGKLSDDQKKAGVFDYAAQVYGWAEASGMCTGQGDITLFELLGVSAFPIIAKHEKQYAPRVALGSLYSIVDEHLEHPDFCGYPAELASRLINHYERSDHEQAAAYIKLLAKWF